MRTDEILGEVLMDIAVGGAVLLIALGTMLFVTLIVKTLYEIGVITTLVLALLLFLAWLIGHWLKGRR